MANRPKHPESAPTKIHRKLLTQKTRKRLVLVRMTTTMTKSNDAPDRAAAEAGLIQLVSDGKAERRPLGDDALWLAAA